MSSPTVRRRAFDDLTAERGILFGGDYNPEQWPRETWREDVELMQRAGVNLVTVGVFSWAILEPRPGAREFGWLDEVLDLLHGAGIAVDLATPTASPPPWLGVRHPEILPVDADGVRLVAGSRNQFSPSSTVYREHALAITRDLAERYAGHPAVRMWHVGNEFGQVDFGDEAAREFRAWLIERYGTIDALNEAWATTFWSQRYDAFDEILPPRRMPYVVNPTQALDFRRFTSDQLLRCCTELRDAIRDAGATQPITTNFMGFFPHVDSQSWADELDVIADDQYPDPADPDSPADIALVQDLMRSLGGGRPWLLMEQAVSATSWRAHNLPKTPERARRDSLQAVARGADGVCFFQWRQSRAGAERFHSAMLPNAGADTDVFAGVVRQGAELRSLRPVVGTTVPAEVAVLFDWTSWWAGEDPTGPTDRLRTLEQLRRWYRVLWRRGVAIDVVAPGADLSRYRVVLAPHSYVIEPDAATGLRTAVEAGAQLVVGPFSGVADANGHLLQGRSPVLLRDLVGVSGEEWGGLPDEPTPLRVEADGPAGGASTAHGSHTATILAERLRTEGARVLAAFATGPLEGRPAITRNAVGAGAAWYLGTVVDDALLAAVLDKALGDAGVRGALGTAGELPEGLEAVRRGAALFLLNHGHAPVTVAVPAGVVDLLTDETSGGSVTVAPGDVRVLMERRSE
ncbi:beta-galactosidase [Agromyces sp. MMS24-JH15]|uniref:beta-galactosidase n=1 Tax=Agromyces sp. MMS24-JH15 TaxID=3243765 RepID=UPI0037494697